MADNDRLEREIEEILGKIEQFPEPESRARRQRRRVFNQARARISESQQAVARQLGRISLSQLMLLSFLVILGAFFFRGRMLPPTVASWLMLAGVLLFVSTFAVTIFGARRQSSGEQRWRGRTIQSPQSPKYQYQKSQPSGASLGARLRYWWAHRTRR